jgi:hypothetical protein
MFFSKFFYFIANEWLNAVVIVERAFIVIKGVHFDGKKTKRTAKFIIPLLLIFIILTNIHDPLHRQLIDDTEEQRVWCTVSYSENVQLFDSITKIFHFLAPFVLNASSAIIIIIVISRNHSTTKKQTTYIDHLRKQVRQHRHLLISPVILFLLNLPRLIISFISGCMKSARDPWIYLCCLQRRTEKSFLNLLGKNARRSDDGYIFNNLNDLRVRRITKIVISWNG